MIHYLGVIPTLFLLSYSFLRLYLTHINYVLMLLSTFFTNDILNGLVRSTNISSSIIWVMVFPFWNQKYKNQMNVNTGHYLFSVLCCILNKKGSSYNIQENLVISLLFHFTYNFCFFNHYYPELQNHHLLKWILIPLSIVIEIIV